MMTKHFQVKTVKNCRKYTKKCYQLDYVIDHSLIQAFDGYGVLQLHEFSRYSPLAKDSFYIRLLDELEISGAITDQLLYIVIAKEANHDLFDELEQVLFKWGMNQTSK